MREQLRDSRPTQPPQHAAIAMPSFRNTPIDEFKAVLDISGETDFAPGLTYVAMSRVKSPKGLMFEDSFDLQRLQKRIARQLLLERWTSACGQSSK
jgi:hypothetical protein